jgi:hypothetical protein
MSCGSLAGRSSHHSNRLFVCRKPRQMKTGESGRRAISTDILDFPARVLVTDATGAAIGAANMIPDRFCASTRATWGPQFLQTHGPSGRGGRRAVSCR